MKKSFPKNEPTVTVQVRRLTLEQAKSVGVDRIADENCVVNIPVSKANSLKLTNSTK